MTLCFVSSDVKNLTDRQVTTAVTLWHHVAVALASHSVHLVPTCGCCLHNGVALDHSSRTGCRQGEVSMGSLVDQLVIPGTDTPPPVGGHIGCQCLVARWRLPLHPSTADIPVSVISTVSLFRVVLKVLYSPILF